MKRLKLMGVLITSFILVQPTLVVGQGKELSDRAKAMDTNKDGLVQKTKPRVPCSPTSRSWIVIRMPDWMVLK